jgi:hypothetical protein
LSHYNGQILVQTLLEGNDTSREDLVLSHLVEVVAYTVAAAHWAIAHARQLIPPHVQIVIGAIFQEPRPLPVKIYIAYTDDALDCKDVE